MSTRRDKTRRTPHTIGTKAPEDSSGIQTELAQVLRHLREQPPHKLALDGAFDSASPTHQARIWQKLTTLNVDADALLEMLADDEATQKLVQEVVAAQRLRHWKTIEPHYRKLWNLFDKLRTELASKQLTLPESVDELFLLLCEKLSAPARLDSEPRSALSPAELAKLRRRGSVNAALHQRIGPVGDTARSYEKSLTAIRQRLMPLVRGKVYQQLRPAVARDTERARRQKFPQAYTRAIQEQAAKSTNAHTRRLTAEFIRAFYPLFGEGTSAEHVRKAVETKSD